MKIKAALIFLLCSVCVPVFSQNDHFEDAFGDFATSRLWAFEEIPVEWKMDGVLQADLNEGLNNLLENNPALAIENLSVVLDKDSTIWQAYYYRASANKQLKKFRAARNDMRSALKIHGDFYEGLVELAKILHFQGETVESERTVNKAIRLDRSRGAAYYIKGDINVTQNQKSSATNNYRDCLAADSLFHDARIKLALLDAVSRKDITAALPRLNEVLAYDSLHKSALMFRSIIFRETNKKQAVSDLSNLILVSPDNLIALYHRGVLTTELENFEQAFNDFHKVIKMTATDDNSFAGQQSWLDKKIDLQNAGAYVITRLYGLPEKDRFLIKKAYCHLITTEYDKSIASLAQIALPGEPVVVYLKAVAYEHKGRHLDALRYYSLALEIDNSISEAYKKRGIYRQELKQWGGSVDDFTAVLKIYPDGFLINRLRGVSYYHLNRFRDAIADYNVYLESDSTNKEIIGYRGMAYLQLNERLVAYGDFASSGNAQLLDFKDATHLIDSVLHRRDTTQALVYIDIITDNAPYFTEGYARKFRIHMARKEWKPVEDRILEAIRHSRSDAPSSEHSYLLTVMALSHSKNRHFDDAVRKLNEAIKFDEKNDLAYLERGRLFVEMGKRSRAESDFRTASSLGNEEARKLLAKF